MVAHCVCKVIETRNIINLCSLQIPRPGSRVFTLKFIEDSERTLFFWAQEANAERDDAIVESINLALASVLDGKLLPFSFPAFHS